MNVPNMLVNVCFHVSDERHGQPPRESTQPLYHVTALLINIVFIELTFRLRASNTECCLVLCHGGRYRSYADIAVHQLET